jgi:hypothetical protein
MAAGSTVTVATSRARHAGPHGASNSHTQAACRIGHKVGQGCHRTIVGHPCAIASLWRNFVTEFFAIVSKASPRRKLWLN